ncbi:hypothetical protein B7463_g5805, partial [Scytalidium lignicola]
MEIKWIMQAWKTDPSMEDVVITVYLPRQDFLTFGEELDDRYYKPLEKSYHLQLLSTAEEHRRKGAATALINWAVENARKDGAIIGTEPNLLAEQFYYNRGFTKIGQEFDTSSTDPQLKMRVPVLQYIPSSQEDLI